MARPFVLLQLSDPHVGASWGGDPVAALSATVEAVRRLPDRPDAVVVTGDLADAGAPEQYAVVRELVERLEAPIHVAAGNHDDREALRRAFDLPGAAAAPIQYAADLGPLGLVLVDSVRLGQDSGELDRDRLGWLDAALDEAAGRPTIVALHHPPPITGSAPWDAICLPPSDAAALGEILARHPHAERVVAGHVHKAVAGSLGGRPVLAAPSAYMQSRLDLSAPRIAFGDDPPGFAVHALVDGAIASFVQFAPAG